MCVLMLKISHRPDGKIADAAYHDSHLRNCGPRSGQLQIIGMVRAAET